VDLLRREIACNLPHRSHDLFNKWLGFARLQSYKMTLALVRDFNERIASHILDTWEMLANPFKAKLADSVTFVCLMHEFE
jgi:hypothetical protein